MVKIELMSVEKNDPRTELWQWDSNRQVKIRTAEEITEVHFAQTGDVEALVVEAKRDEGCVFANIPNIMLQNTRNLTVYVVKDGVTLTSWTYPIMKREKPCDYVYTETEILDFKTLQEKLENQISEEIKTAAEEIKAEVGASEFVKKTDYASDTEAGIVKVVSSYGVAINNDNVLWVQQANQNQIDQKKEVYRPIAPANLDYAVMKALSDSKLEWTDEQKQLVRELIGSVGNGDFATKSNAGVVRIGAGLSLNSENNTIQTEYADKDTLKNKASYHNPITPKFLDYAIKIGLIDNKEEWSDDEKALVRQLLNSIGIEDFATSEKAGIVKVGSDSAGVKLNANNMLVIAAAGTKEIKEMASANRPITPYYLPWAIKYGLVQNNLEWTEEEQKAARDLFGVTALFDSIVDGNEVAY